MGEFGLLGVVGESRKNISRKNAMMNMIETQSLEK